MPSPPYSADYRRYSPYSGYTGSDSFTYKICDQYNLCSTATIYILVLPGTDPVPNVKGCPTDPAGCGGSGPAQNAFRGVSAPSAGSAGPSGPDPVDLTTGREAYLPPPDLAVYNPTGPGVFWQLGYLSYQALVGVTGYGSPGLTRGWVHGYDVTVQGVTGSWDALKLNYPSGATESLTPQLGSGQPTGAFTTVAGAPYIVTGVSGSPTGTWQSVTVTWKDQTKSKFTLHSGTTYVLSQLTKGDIVGGREQQSANLHLQREHDSDSGKRFGEQPGAFVDAEV